MRFNPGDRVVNISHFTPVGERFSTGTVLSASKRRPDTVCVRYDDGYAKIVNVADLRLENQDDYLPGTDGDLT